MSRVFLITANVGSVFENIDIGLPVWLNEIIAKVQLDNPDFLALHFQETGGKDYKNGSKVIQIFFSTLVDSFAKAGYNLLEGIVDSDADVKPEFTALSNVYFIRKNYPKPIEIWDFGSKRFVALNSASSGKLFIGKDIKSNHWNQKEKFPQHFFPNCKWSRKGFARSRWRLDGVTFDLVNIHLFHDSHNLIAASTFPSPFSQNRQRTLNFMLEKFRTDDLENVPMFIFGDFNFRVNTFDIFDILRKEAGSAELEASTVISTMDHNSEEGSLTSDFVIDAKKFSVSNHEQRFKENWGWLRPYDFESSHFETLSEFEIHFHPTYPFAEDDPGKFMKTRCPAWCDRILFTHDSKSIIAEEPISDYNLIGSSVCMGDHKPVYLKFNLRRSKPSCAEPREELCASGRNAAAQSLEPGTFLPPPTRSRFVSFLRDNLSFHVEPLKTCVSKAPSLAPSTASTASASSSSSTSSARKCCFLKIRTHAGGPPQTLPGGGGVNKHGKQNMLLSVSSQGSNPLCLDLDQVKGQNGQNVEISTSEPEVRLEGTNGSSSASKKTCMRKGRKSEDGNVATRKCCPKCSIL